MDLWSKTTQAAGFISRQAQMFWDIVILKIRIIGFANKRIDLFTRLGRLAYLSHPQPGLNGPEAEALIVDIKETEREIKEAEEKIVAAAERARMDRRDFFGLA